jgi:carboxylesterase type B
MPQLIHAGLFSKAILQSGVAISIWSTFKEPVKQAKRFALKFGCPTDNTSEMVNCMKRVETEEFVKAHEETLVRNTVFENSLLPLKRSPVVKTYFYSVLGRF